MTNLIPTPEETEKLVNERIVSLRQQIEEEKYNTHERIQRIEERYKEQIRDAQRDLYERTEPMRRELDELLRVSTLKHALSPIPPIIISLDDALKVSLTDLRNR